MLHRAARETLDVQRAQSVMHQLQRVIYLQCDEKTSEEYMKVYFYSSASTLSLLLSVYNE
jgi:hypothetical protein